MPRAVGRAAFNEVRLRSCGFLPLVVLVTALVVAAGLVLERDREDGRQIERLMSGTPYETALYVFDSGRSGHTVLILAGVHGNEPGAWLAAQALLEEGLPHERGTVLLVPRANVQAVAAGIRSAPTIGDLNRLYFADPEVFPMSRMAAEIAGAVRRHEVDVVLDLHESWDFHDPSSTSVELSALGQTISPHRSEPSLSLTRALVDAANARLPADERFLYHEFPAGHVDELIVPLPEGVSEKDVPRKSGLDLPEAFPGLASVLVEVGQQQPMARRVAQQIAVVHALLDLLDARAYEALDGPLG